MLFRDRADAGHRLAQRLRAQAGRRGVVVLGLPRGGVIVAEQVARDLGIPLDVFGVRKLGVPGHPELAMGAIASGGVLILNRDVVGLLGIPESDIEAVVQEETRELERRERAYRSGLEPLDVKGKTVILVDDGLATGATMRAAVEALRERQAGWIVAAVPVGPPDACEELGNVADDTICLFTPEPFLGVGLWYEDFGQSTDDDVRAALARAASGPELSPVA